MTEDNDKVRTLTCCCCGEGTRGRQWFNRDTGFGLCEKCADWIPQRWPDQGMTSLYGIRGYHYAIEDDA